MLFTPGGVVDFGDNVLDHLAAGIEAVVKAHRVEAVPEIAQLGEQTHRSLRPPSTALLDQVAHALGEWLCRVAKVIGTAKPRQVGAPRGPQPEALEQAGQFLEVEIQHKQAVLELMAGRRKAPVPNSPDVEAAVAHRPAP